MRLNVLTVVVVFVTATGAEAKCPPYQCRLVTLEPSACTAEVIDTVIEAAKIIDKYRLGPGTYTKEQLLTRVRPEKLSGVRLGAPSETSIEVPCAKGEPLVGNETAPAPDPHQPVSYFFGTDNPNACARFLGRRNTLFAAHPCCDTVPPNGACVLGGRLLFEVPAHLQSNPTAETDARKSGARGSP